MLLVRPSGQGQQKRPHAPHLHRRQNAAITRPGQVAQMF